MSIKNVELPVTINGQNYYGIREIGFNAHHKFVIDMWTTPLVEGEKLRGIYFATPPISNPKEYDTRAVCTFNRGNLTILDDYGMRTKITADNSTINTLAQECFREGLPVIS